MKQSNCIETTVAPCAPGASWKVAAVAVLVFGLLLAAVHAGEIEIPVGGDQGTVAVQVLDNTLAQRDRAIVFTVLPGGVYTVDGAGTHTYVIEDDDLPTVGFQADLPSSPTGAGAEVFYVAITGATGTAYPFQVGVQADDGEAGLDYTLSPVDVAPGDFAAAYEIARIVPPSDNSLHDRTLTLTLEALHSEGELDDYALGLSQHTYTVPGVKPVVSLSVLVNGEPVSGDSAAAEGDEDVITYVLSLDRAMVEPITVNYALGGTAQPDADYVVQEKQVITFDPGDTEKAISYRVAP